MALITAFLESGAIWFSCLGAIFCLLAVIAGWSHTRLPAKLIATATVIAGCLAVTLDPGLLLLATESVTRLSGLILAVMLLSKVLSRTQALRNLSVSLFSGKSVSRYLSLVFGTALVSVPLNIGSVGILGSLVAVQKEREGSSAATRNAARAILRGFGAAPAASPLSIGVVVTLTMLPGVNSLQLSMFSVPFVVVMLCLGLAWREKEPLDGKPPPSLERPSLRSWILFPLIIIGICLCVFSLTHLTDIAYANAVTLACVGVVILARLINLLKRQFPPVANFHGNSNELAIVSGSAFVGAIISALVAGHVFAAVELPSWIWLPLSALVPWLLFFGGLAAVNPIVTGTLAGGILGPLWPEAAQLGLAIGMVTGWGITAYGTPYTANAILMEKVAGYPAGEASLRWNLGLSLTCLTSASLLAVVLTWAGLAS